jgi:ammonium transporter, Amt family
MIKNLLDACGAGVAFYMFGYAFSYGHSYGDMDGLTFIGSSNFFLSTSGNQDKVDLSFWFFQYAFSATAVTIVAGTLAERCKMASYFCYSFWLTGFVYPVVCHTFCTYLYC